MTLIMNMTLHDYWHINDLFSKTESIIYKSQYEFWVFAVVLSASLFVSFGAFSHRGSKFVRQQKRVEMAVLEK